MAPFYFAVCMHTSNQVGEDDTAAIPVVGTMQILQKRWICPRAATGMKEKEGVRKCGAVQGDEALAMMTIGKKTTVFVNVAQVSSGRRGEDKWTDGKMKPDVA